MAQFSGQIVLSSTVATRLPSLKAIVCTLKAHPDNTDTVWVGYDGHSLVVASGYPLNPGEAVAVAVEGNINAVYAIADVNAEKVCWILSDK